MTELDRRALTLAEQIPEIVDATTGRIEAVGRDAIFVVAREPAAVDAFVQKCDELAIDDHVFRVAAIPHLQNGDVDTGALRHLVAVDRDTASDPFPGEWSASGVAAWTDFVTRPEGGALVAEDVRPLGSEAIVDGGEAVIPDVSNLAQTLLQAALENPEHGVTIVEALGDTDRVEYGALYSSAVAGAMAIQTRGVRPGDVVIVSCSTVGEMIRGFWSVVLSGAVPALLPPALTPAAAARLEAAFESLEKPWIWVDERGRRGAAERLPSLALARWLIVAPAAVSGADDTADLAGLTRRPQDDAAIFLTSGSTGIPKGVVLSHKNILAMFGGVIALWGFNRDDISLNWLPLDHVASLIMFHARDVFVGCEHVAVATDYVVARPLRWLELLATYRATLSWAPNFAFSLLLDELRRQPMLTYDLTSLRYLCNAGELITPAALELEELLVRFGAPRGVVVSVWGMSETTSNATFTRLIDAPCIQLGGADYFAVGAPLRGFSFRVVDDRGTLAREREVGSVEVSGELVFGRYFGRSDETANAFTSDGWLKTGDLGAVVDQQLVITGREKDIVIVNGVNVSCGELERALWDIAGIDPTQVAVVPVRSPGSATDQIVVFIGGQGEASETELAKNVARTLVVRTGIRPLHVISLRPEEFPRTSKGTIQRSHLAREAAAFVSETPSEPQEAENAINEVKWILSECEREPVGLARSAILAGSTPDVLEALSEALVAGGVASVVVPISNPTAPGDQARLRKAVLDAPGGSDAVLVSTDGGSGRHGYDTVAAAHVMASALLERGSRLRSVRFVHSSDRGEWVGSAIQALFEAAAIEAGGIRAQRIELRAGDDAHMLVAIELQRPTFDPFVILDGASRLVARLTPVNIVDPTTDVAGKLCGVIGFGGIGKYLAHLLADLGARVIVLSTRTKDQLEQEDAKELAHLERINQLAGFISYSPGQMVMDERIAAIEVGNGPLHRLFYVSGEFHQMTVGIETADALWSGIRERVASVRTFIEIIRRRESATLLVFSSVAGAFPGPGLAAYAMSAAASDQVVGASRSANDRCSAISWTAWSGLGMAKRLPPAQTSLSARAGLPPLDTRIAAQKAIAATTEHSHVFVGLDTTNPRITALLDPARVALISPVRRYVHLRSAATQVGLEQATHSPLKGSRDHAAILRQIWSDVLKVDAVALDDDFFELGGDSLNVAEVVAEAAAQGIVFSPSDVFEHPLLADLLASMRKGLVDSRVE